MPHIRKTMWCTIPQCRIYATPYSIIYVTSHVSIQTRVRGGPRMLHTCSTFNIPRMLYYHFCSLIAHCCTIFPCYLGIPNYYPYVEIKMIQMSLLVTCWLLNALLMNKTHCTKFDNSAMSHQSVFGGRWLSEAQIHGGNFLLMMCMYSGWKGKGHLVAVLLPNVFFAEFANVVHGGLALEYIVCTTHM